MKRLFSRASFLAALVAIAMPVVLAGPAAAEPTQKAAVLITLNLPPKAGSAYEQRLIFHRLEAKSHGWAADGSDDPHGVMKTAPTWGAADYSNVFKAPWAIVHQDITVEVDPTKARLKANVILTVRAAKAGIKQINLRTDMLEKVSVTDINGKALQANWKKVMGNAGGLVVGLPHALTVNTDTELVVSYDAQLNCTGGGYRLRPCNFDSNYWSVQFFRYYLSHGQAGRHPFKSDLYVITPIDRMAAAPGIPRGAKKLADGRLSWHFEQPERTENAGFSIAKYKAWGDDPNSGVANPGPFVRTYARGGYNGQLVVDLARQVIEFAGQRMGAFPWAGFSLIQVAQNFGGGYAPLGGIFMLQSVFGAKKNSYGWTNLVELQAHEIAHQWWGNYVRPASANDTSLSESLAEFTSCLYTEKNLKSRSQMIGNNLSYVYTVSAKDDRPLGSSAVHYSKKYVQIMYHKGAVVMDMMRTELGEEQWLKVLTEFGKQYGRDYASWKHFPKVIEKVTGKDMSWFFQQWFAETGSIRGQILTNVSHSSTGSHLRLRFAHLGEKPMRFRLPLRAYFSDGTTDNVFVDIIPEKGTHLSIVEHTFDKRLVGLRPDYGRRLLRRFQVLTPGDVNLNGLADGTDLLEIAFRSGRAIVFKNKWGKESFFPNGLWDELYDVVADHRIDVKDIDAVAMAIGEESIAF